jgi:hypothetical protein
MEIKKEEFSSSKGGVIVDWSIPFFHKKKWIKKASEAVDQYNNGKNKKSIRKTSPE